MQWLVLGQQQEGGGTDPQGASVSRVPACSFVLLHCLAEMSAPVDLSLIPLFTTTGSLALAPVLDS